MVVAPFDGRRVLLWAGTAGTGDSRKVGGGAGVGVNVREVEPCDLPTNAAEKSSAGRLLHSQVAYANIMGFGRRRWESLKSLTS